jgi:hypothetical protein
MMGRVVEALEDSWSRGNPCPRIRTWVSELCRYMKMRGSFAVLRMTTKDKYKDGG